MRARQTRSFQRTLVLLNYLSLGLLQFFFMLTKLLGWHPYLVIVMVVLLAVLVSTFIPVHLATGYWRLIHTSSARLNEDELRLTRTALALAFVWFVVLTMMGVYFKLYVMFNRLNIVDLLAILYLANTLPSSCLAWGTGRSLNWREALMVWVTRLLAIFAVVAALFVLNLLVIRPWQQHWGATTEEVNRAMPGDELVERADFNATRAVTVNAAPEDVWPWLVQMGYQRAGFYSYDSLDNAGIPSARRIIPEFQDLEAGDRIQVGKGAFMTVISLEPPVSLVLQFENGPWAGNTWDWGVYAQGAGQTRLVSRVRATYDWSFPHILPWMFIDTFEIIMMRRCLLGIKERVEAYPAST